MVSAKLRKAGSWQGAAAICNVLVQSLLCERDQHKRQVQEHKREVEEQRRQTAQLEAELLRLQLELERYKKWCYGPRAD